VFSFADTAYLQLSSEVDQKQTKVIAELIDAQNKIDYDVVTGVVTFTRAGSYLVVYAPQTDNIFGCSNYWLVKNEVNVENSNIRVCQGSPERGVGKTTVGVAQAIILFEKGDTLTFMTSGSLGVEATRLNPMYSEPLIPSVIISIMEL